MKTTVAIGKSQKKIRKILFVVHAAHRVPDVLAFLKNISNDYEVNALLIGELYYKYNQRFEKENLKAIPFNLYDKKNGIRKIEHNRIIISKEKFKKKTTISRICQFAYRYILHNNSLIQLCNEIKLYIQLKRQYDAAIQLIEKCNFDLVIALDERTFGPVISVLKAAKRNKINILIPYFVFATKDALANYRKKAKTSYNFSRKIYSSLYTKLTFRRFKRQTFRNMLFYPPEMLNAINKLGALSKNPWQIGMGMSDVVCVNNRYRHQEFLKNSVPDYKIKVIGDISYDKLYDSYVNRHQIKDKIVNKYRLNKNKKIILIGLPPLAEHDILDWKSHWEAIGLIVDASTRVGENVLVSLHPRMDKKNYMELETEYQLRIIDERLMEVISSSNVYVSTFSSTLIWSVLCGINTVVVNPAKLKYSYYNYLKSINIVQNIAYIENTIKKNINKKKDFNIDWKWLSREKVFDGNVINRYRELIRDLTTS